MGATALDVVADRGYFEGEEVMACEDAGITAMLPKPLTSGSKAKGRFGKQDFVYVAADDVYRCPAGETLRYYYTNEQDGQKLRNYWTSACRHCAIKSRCTSATPRRIKRWEHEHVLEAAQLMPCRNRREVVEHWTAPGLVVDLFDLGGYRLLLQAGDGRHLAPRELDPGRAPVGLGAICREGGAGR